MMQRQLECIGIRVAGVILFAVMTSAKEPHDMMKTETRGDLAAELTQSLQEQILDRWYPLVIDTEHGGYLTRFSAAWEAQGPQDKMIVTQARNVWTTARAAEFFPDNKVYLPASTHGAAFLRDVMWDKEHGGFYWLVTREGNVKPGPDGQIGKQAYGQSFAIYALAAYHAVSGDAEALALAQEAFRWLDDHAHDPVHRGYFDVLSREGDPVRDGGGARPPKDQNSSIHLLEAFTELYRVWPDPHLRTRLEEMLILIRDTIRTDPGYLTLYFEEDWTPVSFRDASEEERDRNVQFDHISYGHDVEIAFLMLEAAETLGKEYVPSTMVAAKQMVDHALGSGWDDDVGGFYDQGYYFKGDTDATIIRDTKNWWAQAEGLNSLLLMGDHFPDDDADYHAKFLTQWNYIKTYLIDLDHGGWYRGGLDKDPDERNAPKAYIWKGNYHNARALMNSARRLRSTPER